MSPLRMILPLLALFPPTLAPCAETAGLATHATISPEPAVLTYAASNNFPLDRIGALSALPEGANGDTVTALITLRDRKGQRQWLANFEIVPLDEKERAFTYNSRTTSKSSTGHVFVFEDKSPLALAIRTAGPFGPKARPAEKNARTLVSPTFLAIGLEKAGEAMMLREELIEAAEKAGKKDFEPPAMSEEQARALAGLGTAMMSFFGAVEKTPGLNDVLWSVLEKPSVFSVVRKRGVSIGFNFNAVARADPGDWGISGNPCYRLGVLMSLNDKPALKCWFYVTTPRPPLLTTAGVVGIVAESPENNGKRAEIRVIAAHRKHEAQR